VPGFQLSQSKFRLSTNEEFRVFLDHNIERYFHRKPMIASSSASRFLALDFNVNRDRVKAVIAVDPVSRREPNLSKISSPVLKIWGSRNKISDPEDPRL
jgi:hypothetical protein